jgi:hypothetical protein
MIPLTLRKHQQIDLMLTSVVGETPTRSTVREQNGILQRFVVVATIDGDKQRLCGMVLLYDDGTGPDLSRASGMQDCSEFAICSDIAQLQTICGRIRR